MEPGDFALHPLRLEFDTDALLSRKISSRTYSVYYPEIRPGTNRYSVVASMNSRFSTGRSCRGRNTVLPKRR